MLLFEETGRPVCRPEKSLFQYKNNLSTTKAAPCGLQRFGALAGIPAARPTPITSILHSINQLCSDFLWLELR